MARTPHDTAGSGIPPEQIGALLRDAAEGDQSAWKALVEHYAPRVFGLVRAQCRNPELAEEITQSAFCTVAEKIGSYVESGRFEAWLFRIALNRLRDEERRRARHARPTDTELLGDLAGPGEASRRGDEEVDERSSLRAALERLAPADQRVIHLRHQADLSFKEIAEVLEEPLGTVLARHHRALRKLREFLEADAGGEGGE